MLISGNTTISRDALYIIVNGFHIESPESFTNLVETLSGPDAFPIFNLDIAFSTLVLSINLNLSFLVWVLNLLSGHHHSLVPVFQLIFDPL